MFTQRHKKRMNLVLVLSLVALISIAAAFAAAKGQPTTSGKSYGQWSAEWLMWIESQGFAPLFEEGDVDCSLGQSGPVWFLAGSGGGPVVRNCSIPQGKDLLFPLINVWWNNVPPEDLTVAEKRVVLDDIMNDINPGLLNSRACNLYSSVDGVSTLFSEYATARAQSQPFPFQGDPEAVIDGYWVMLNLTPGDHTLQFGGALCDFDTGDPIFEVDVTYNLTVVSD